MSRNSRRRSRYRARGSFYFIWAAFFTVAATAALLIAGGYTLSLPDRSLDRNGLLVLNSVPGKAFITINNRVHKDQTSARVKLRPGHYHVKVDKPGVIPWEKDIVIERGEAVFEENILLFESPTQRRSLASGPVAAHALSPNGRFVAYAQPETGGTAIWWTDVTNSTPAAKLTVVPTAEPLTALRVNGDASRVLLSTATATFVVRTDTSQGPVRVDAGGAVFFHPADSDRLIAQLGSSVANIAIADGSRQTLLDQVTTTAATSDALYATVPAGVLRYDLRSGSQKTQPLAHPVRELTSVPSTDAVLAKDTRSALYLISRDSTVEITGTAGAYTALGTTHVAYSSGNEIRVWQSETKSSKLVTRLSTAPQAITLMPSGHYLLYLNAGELHSIADDGSNDEVLIGGMAGTAQLADDFNAIARSDIGEIFSIKLLRR